MIALDCNMRQPNQGFAPGRVREDLQRGNGFVSFVFGTLLRPFQRTAGRHLLDAVLETMATCGSLEWTQKRAEDEADKVIAALQILPDTPRREALIGLAPIAGQGDH